MFGHEIRIKRDARIKLAIQRAFFVNAIDLDRLVDWLCAQSRYQGERSLGSVLSLSVDDNLGLRQFFEQSVGPWSQRLGRLLVRHHWISNFRGPMSANRQDVKKRLYRDSSLVAVELAIWDLDALVVDMRACGIDDPIRVLVNRVSNPLGEGESKIHFTSPATPNF